MGQHTTILLTIAVATVGLSGCVLPGLGDDEGDGTLRRIVEFTVNEEAFEEMEDLNDPGDFLRAFSDVSYEYSHGSGEVATANVLVTFKDSSGREREYDLDRFTNKDVLRAGDTVVIDGVHFTSGMILEGPGGTLAERTGVRAEWLQISGYPLPLAADEDTYAKWDSASSLTIDLGAEGGSVEYDDDYDGVLDGHASLERADLDVGLEAEGLIEVEGDARGSELVLAISSGMQTSLKALGEAVGSASELNGGESSEWGFEAEAAGNSDTYLELIFDRDRNLNHFSYEATSFMDGDITAWTPNHSRSEGWVPDGIEHPFIDETFSESEEIPTGDEAVIESIAAFVDSLWSLELAQGDEYFMDLDLEELSYGEVDGSLELRVQVAAREDKDVAGHSYDTLRLSQSFALHVEHEEFGKHDYEFSSSSFWIDADTYIPVLVETDYGIDLDHGEFEPFYALIEASAEGEADRFNAPEDSHLTVRAKTQMELVEFEGDARITSLYAVAGMLAPFLLAGGVGAMAGISSISDPFAQPIDYEDDYHYEEAPINVAFNRDEAEARLTVVRADADAQWNRLTIESDSSTWINWELNGEATSQSSNYAFGQVMAGDYVGLCASSDAGDVTVQVIDNWVGTILAEFHFTSIAACEDPGAVDVQFEQDDELDRLAVTSFSDGATWDDIVFNDDAWGWIAMAINEEAHEESYLASDAPVAAGDFLDICMSGEGEENVTVSVQDWRTYAEIGSYTFEYIQPC